MELWWGSVVVTSLLASGVAMFFGFFVKRVNEWFFERNLSEKIRDSLPPGDMGWPIFGNMFAFLMAFKFSHPDSFISSYVKRFGRTGVYKAFMFGSPSIMVTVPETCKQVLMDEEGFKPGWPPAAVKLIGEKSFIGLSYEEHKRIRKLTMAPINGHEALTVYMGFIEDTVIKTLEKWAVMGEFEFLTHLRKLTFKIIMYIFLSEVSESLMQALEKQYTSLNFGVRAMAINLPGFAFHKALKARKILVETLQGILKARRAGRPIAPPKAKKDMMDNLMDAEDENGEKLSDEEIIDVLIMYLNAGHESSGHITMWATWFLQEHPEIFKKAKASTQPNNLFQLLTAEQEEIVKNRPPGQKGLTLKEYRNMTYLSKVVDETLRVVNISSVVFREANTDINIAGFVIPKGWKVNVWFRTVHMDPEVYPNPTEFHPSRWDGPPPKAGTFLPFGAGSRLCPGNDLAKLEISIFLHYFLLNYK
ncbi:hypothetical protein Sjap_004345 [Stephania japonica]|uniref:Ent-kaurenoic acid oxidase n=1 Tax=Stephania japonica TaxID=461633 RepID=A0AAP0PHR7_9MAGN